MARPLSVSISYRRAAALWRTVMIQSSALRAIAILVAHAAFEPLGVGRDAVRLAGRARRRHELFGRITFSGAAFAIPTLAIFRRANAQSVACTLVFSRDGTGLDRACAQHRQKGASHDHTAIIGLPPRSVCAYAATTSE